jgi:hypothetical protein
MLSEVNNNLNKVQPGQFAQNGYGPDFQDSMPGKGGIFFVMTHRTNAEHERLFPAYTVTDGN